MPVGVQDFPSMIEGEYVYVDKTQFIWKMDRVNMTFFLTRPRRFGKSLYLSTLKAYFEGKKELFKGLAIERIKEENNSEWKTHPVLRLDLSSSEYAEEEHLEKILKLHIKMWEDIYEVKTNIEEANLAFSYILQLLHEKFKEKIVILIDEYDKPLIATLENEELQNSYRSTLKAFYSVIKSASSHIHLSFLTGVTKFSKVSVFSDLNNLFDISFDYEYSSICGITEKELKDHYSPEIELLANKYKKTQEEMLSILKKKYDGYRFSKNEVQLYNPFSLLTAFEKKELGDYWFETGTPSFMVRLLEQKAFKIPDLEGDIEVSLKAVDEYRMDYADLAPLLFQTGYLTVKTYNEEFDTYVLGFPNDEVRYAFLNRLMNVYIRTCDPLSAPFLINEFVNSIRKDDIDKVLTLIKALMASIPYDNFPENKQFLREHNYQTAIYLIFHLMGQYVRTEIHSSQGRSDIEVETVGSIYIFEFKVGAKPDVALAQIKTAGYAEKYEVTKKNIFLVGVSISRNKHTIGKWLVEKLNK